ncbi:uncharacterized protein A4U43_C04F12840 [Asparagus officinalis]|uniref:FLZ-type domain-containing protein n=1 Tax=Asparagus officinalis TaxID=4686 RepID=A0A5P1F583_ASPOF|nr:uncharacterized protein A4U43_C04F12840 [Asparagus officinalis]
MCRPPSSFESLSSLSSSSYANTRMIRKPSLRSMPWSPRVTSWDQSSSDEEPQRYFLDSCFLCKTPLHLGDDIYMYKGDTPFCREECRQEQIDIDEAEERNKKLSKKLKSKISNNNTYESYEIHVRNAEAVVAV